MLPTWAGKGNVMRLWNNAGEYLYMGPDGYLFLFKPYEKMPDGTDMFHLPAGTQINMKCAVPKPVTQEEFETFLMFAKSAIDAKLCEMYLTSLGKIEFDSGKTLNISSENSIVLINEESTGKCIVFANAKRAADVRFMIEYMIDSFFKAHVRIDEDQ